MNINWDAYPNFSEAEFMCKCGCGRADMQPEFLYRIQLLRTACGFPFRITSGFRCEEHDRAEKGAGVHPSGLACDINVLRRTGLNHFRFVQAARFSQDRPETDWQVE